MEQSVAPDGYQNPRREAEEFMQLVLTQVDVLVNPKPPPETEEKNGEEEFVNPLPNDASLQFSLSQNQINRGKKFVWPLSKGFTAEIGQQAVHEYAKVSSARCCSILWFRST